MAFASEVATVSAPEGEPGASPAGFTGIAFAYLLSQLLAPSPPRCPWRSSVMILKPLQSVPGVIRQSLVAVTCL